MLFVDWNDNEERVIYTKPSAYHEAKERGEEPMLPEQIVWPLGTNGYQALKDAWGLSVMRFSPWKGCGTVIGSTAKLSRPALPTWPEPG